MRNFIPLQFWSRYKFLSNYCTEERGKNSNLKTLIRFTDIDLEVLFKYKNKDEQYFNVSLKEIEKEAGALPKFDHSISWTKRQDRPPKKSSQVSQGSSHSSISQRFHLLLFRLLWSHFTVEKTESVTPEFESNGDGRKQYCSNQ